MSSFIPVCRKSRKTGNKCQNKEQSHILNAASIPIISTQNLRSKITIIDDIFDLNNKLSDLRMLEKKQSGDIATCDCRKTSKCQKLDQPNPIIKPAAAAADFVDCTKANVYSKRIIIDDTYY